MSKFSEFWKTKNAKRVLISIAALVILFIIMSRSCSSKMHHGTYHIAQDPFWYPLNLLGKESSVTAFADDLLIAISQKQSIPIEIISTSSYQLLEGLENENYDGALTALIPTPQTRVTFLFSNPFLTLGPVLIVLENSPIKSLSEMNDKIVGMGSDFSFIFDIAKYPQFIIKRYDIPTNALEDLVAGKIDGVIMGAFPAYTYANGGYKGKIKIISTPLTQEGLRLITLHNTAGEALIKNFNDGLDSLKKSGTYDALINKWGLVRTEG